MRVLIADDQPLFRDGLRLLLEKEPGFCVIGEAGKGMEAVQLTQRSKPDLVLLDLALTRCSGMEALSLIQSMSLPLRTLILATTTDKYQTFDALRRGASGILLKESTAQLLFKCIQSVMEGECWIGRKSVAHLVQELRKYSGPLAKKAAMKNWHLTPRQSQIVAEIISGKTNKEIALNLGLSDQTVKHHLTSIFNELGVYNRLELALFAVTHDLASHLINK